MSKYEETLSTHRTAEEAAERLAKDHCNKRVNTNTTEFQVQQLILKGAHWQSQRILKFINNEDNHTEGELGNSCIDVQALINFITGFKKESRNTEEIIDQIAQEKNIKDNAYAWIYNQMSESPEEDIEFCAEVAEDYWKDGFKQGAESKYSEEEVLSILESLVEHPTKPGYKRRDILKFIEQFKKKI